MPPGRGSIGWMSAGFPWAVAIVAAACALAAGAPSGGAEPAAPVTVATDKAPYPVTAGGTSAVRTENLQQIVLENEYVRAVILPEVGGRIVQVYDKVAKADMFLKAYPPLVCQPELRHSAYNSQCGGIVVNFPAFHHGNSCADNWNWQVDRTANGAAVVTLGWTDPHLRQRVVQRVELRPGDSLLRSTCRYLNLNPYATGFSPWINTLFPYNDDLQWIMPTQQVVPHGFNADNLEVQPWPWPQSDESSICHWRNSGKGQVSVFALQLERDFSGVYYHTLDRGTARIFDRREQPGLKLWHLPPDPKPPLLSPQAGFELWSSPALVHEDPLWWEGYAVRDCHDAWMPVHGSGGFTEANAHGAINLVRAADHVEIGACLTRREPGAVVSLVALDGTWWRSVADLGPDRPLRHRLDRVPGRTPLELRVTDAAGELLISCVDRPDPGLRTTPRFTGKPLNQAHGVLRSEQYHPLWRGATGDKQPFAALAAGPYREQIAADPKAVPPRLGLARTLLMDAQLRSGDRPVGLPAEEVAGFQKGRLAEAIAAVEPVREDPAAAILGGEAWWRLGNDAAAAEWFARAGDDAAAQLGRARALAALGRIEEAATAAAAAARGLPRTPTAIQVAAGIDILRGRHADAIRSLERLIAQDPVDATTFMLLERAERGAGNEPRAAAAGRRVAELQGQTHEPVDLEAACEQLGLAALRTP
jgi:hypothetical protein